MYCLVGKSRFYHVTNELRVQKLKASNRALWDVLASCKRHSSLDADIDIASISPNDFEALFLSPPNITNDI